MINVINVINVIWYTSLLVDNNEIFNDIKA